MPTSTNPKNDRARLWRHLRVAAVLCAGGLVGLLVLVVVHHAYPRGPGVQTLPVRRAYLGAALVWLVGAVAVPAVACRAVIAGRARRKLVLLVAALALGLAMASLPGGWIATVEAVLCFVSGMMVLVALSRLGLELFRSRLAVATGVVSLACVVFAAIFWMDPLLVGLPASWRLPFLNAVLHVHPLAALCDVFGPAAVRALQQTEGFSYDMTRLQDVDFNYPQWWIWVLVNQALVVVSVPVREVVRRLRRR